MTGKNLKTIEYKISQENPIINKNSISEKMPEPKFSEVELAKIREAVLKEIEAPAPSLKAKGKKEKLEAQMPAVIKEKKENKAISTEEKPINLAKITKYLNFKRIFFLCLKSLIIAVVLFSIISLIGIYLAGWQGDIAKILASYLPLPVVLVNKTPVSLNDYFTDLAAIENYFKRNNIQAPAKELRSRVMKSLIYKEIINQLARVQQLSVSDNEISDELAESSLKQNTVEQLNLLVQQLYGWDFTIYLNKVIKPLVLLHKVEENFNQNSGNSQIYRQLEDYRQQLLADPNKFASIAGEANQDETKSVAGDRGWFKLNDLNFELQSAVLNLNINEISQVIESAESYQIIKLKEKVLDQKDGLPNFHLFHIFLKKSSFQKYLDAEIKKAKVITLIKI